jgi:hypothetical protein
VIEVDEDVVWGEDPVEIGTVITGDHLYFSIAVMRHNVGFTLLTLKFELDAFGNQEASTYP